MSTVAEGKEGSRCEVPRLLRLREAVFEDRRHRALALSRGRNEGRAARRLELPEELDPAMRWSSRSTPRAAHRGGQGIAEQRRRADAWLMQTARRTWSVKTPGGRMELFTSCASAPRPRRSGAFAANLHDLLLAAPAGNRVTMGLDPGLRTGVKVAVVDRTGKLLGTATLYPHVPRNDWDGALRTARAAGAQTTSNSSHRQRHRPREADKASPRRSRAPPGTAPHQGSWCRAGASGVLRPELASREFPQLDVSLRGAVSIARRLRDPLAELVKIDPKSIGVGQYQHDVSQVKLAKRSTRCRRGLRQRGRRRRQHRLGAAAGADLRPVGPGREHRAASRRQRPVPPSRAAAEGGVASRPKTFEQAAGFLRIPAGDDPLDASSVHPEALSRWCSGSWPTCGGRWPKLMPRRRDAQARRREVHRRALRPADGARHPGRARKARSRPATRFRTATFRDGIEELAQLGPGMLLEGVVTNVTAFGAFVDVGVHQDGLVHISVMSNRFVRIRARSSKAGDIVR